MPFSSIIRPSESFRLHVRLRIRQNFVTLKNYGVNSETESCGQCWGAGAEGRGAEIKLPPGPGAEITNCVFGSFLFIRDLKNFYRTKVTVADEVFCKLLPF